MQVLLKQLTKLMRIPLHAIKGDTDGATTSQKKNKNKYIQNKSVGGGNYFVSVSCSSTFE